jgi:ABC-type Fe3+ transport system permease subunit
VFGACILFALWGGISVYVWSAIESHFWRSAAVLALVLLLIAAIAALMIAISLLERKIRRKR